MAPVDAGGSWHAASFPRSGTYTRSRRRVGGGSPSTRRSRPQSIRSLLPVKIRGRWRRDN